MKRIGVLLTTVGLVVLTWLVARQSGTGPEQGPAPAEASRRGDDPLATEAGSRYRQAQATHWRQVLLVR